MPFAYRRVSQRIKGSNMPIVSSPKIFPQSATAGESVVVSLSFTVGDPGIIPGGALLVDFPGYLGATRPQCYYSEIEGYVSIDVSEPELPFRTSVTDTLRSRIDRAADPQGFRRVRPCLSRRFPQSFGRRRDRRTGAESDQFPWDPRIHRDSLWDPHDSFVTGKCRYAERIRK
jgi:hypothetical protein